MTLSMKPDIVDRFKTKKHVAALVILLIYVVSAVAYGIVTPLWEAPDEVGHAGFVMHLRQSHTLPVQRIGSLGSSHHPPLYYLIAAIISAPADINDPTGTIRANPEFMWAGSGGSDVNLALHGSAETFPYRGQALWLHLARLASVLMGLITVALVIAIGWHIFGEYPWIGLLAGALTAFVPQFLFISGAINNDNLLTMAATGLWWQTLRAMKMPRRWQNWTFAGIWLAVAVLAKSSAAIPGLVVGLTLVVYALRNRSFGLLIRGGVALVLPVLLLTGWWFVRNQTLYGDPLGWSMFQEVYRVVMRTTPLAWNDVHQFFNTQIDSFVGVFGWMNVRATPAFYRIVRICGLLGLVGLAPFFARYRKELSRDQQAGLVFLAFTIVAQECYLLWAIQRFDASWYQGRYLFTVIGPIMIFLSLGIAGWLPRRRAVLPVTALILVLVGVALYMPLRIIAPAYRTVTLPKSALWLVPNKTELMFGSAFKLRGYEIQSAKDGSTLILKLYWQATGKPDFDYSAFVHLIDESGQIVAQNDHAPGEGLGYLPTSWNVEDIIADEHVLPIPPQLSPGTYRIRVGMYNWQTGEQLPVTAQDRLIGNFTILDRPYTRR
jgi:4-amino-4-deoxy-L-arabinose transferase-like glycosyltransferase